MSLHACVLVPLWGNWVRIGLTIFIGEPWPEVPAPEDEPEVTAQHYDWQNLEKVFGKEMALILDIGGEGGAEFIKAILGVTMYGEQAKNWMSWSEAYIGQVLARDTKLEHMVESEMSRFDAKAEFLDKLLQKLRDARVLSASKLDSFQAAMKADFDTKHETRSADIKFREAKLEQRRSDVSAYKHEVDKWAKHQDDNWRYFMLDSKFTGMHEAYVTQWTPQATFNDNLAFVRDTEVILNFGHQYWKGYMFGVWLRSTKATITHDSRWYLMDTRTFRQEEHGLRTPTNSLAKGWFLGIRHGLVKEEEMMVLEWLDREAKAGRLMSLKDKPGHCKLEQRAPEWLKEMDQMPHWLTKYLD